jgi:hypothetical protein
VVRLFFTFLIFLLPLQAAEFAGSLALVPATSSANRFTVRIDAVDPGTGLVATDTRTTNASGFIRTRMDVDAEAGKVRTLSFEGGDVALTDMNFNLRVLVFVTVATLNTSGLRGFPTTPLPPGPVDFASGAFEAANHDFTINQGTVTGAVVGQEEPISANFSESPVTGPGEGTGTVLLSPVSETATHRTFQATVELPVAIDQTSDDGIRIRVSGRLRAQGQIVVPKNPYLLWASAAGLGGLEFTTEIRPGEAAGLLWAMGLQPGDSLTDHAPQIVTGPQGNPTALINFPAGGSAGLVTVEISNTLAVGSWAPAPPATLSSGANPLPPGTKGPVTLELSGSRGFVRLSATRP